MMLANIHITPYSIKFFVEGEFCFSEQDCQTLWSEFFRIRGKKVIPISTSLEQSLSRLNIEGFRIEICQQKVMQMPISNLLESERGLMECQERAYRVSLQTLQNMQRALGLRYGKVKLFMDHSWTLLRMKKGVSDGT